MNELGHLLFVYTGLMVISASLAGALWIRHRTALHRALFLVWATGLLGLALQGWLQTFPWLAFAYALSNFLISLSLTDLFRHALFLRAHWRVYRLTAAASVLISLALLAGGARFWAVALPMAAGTSLPLMDVLRQSLRLPRGTVSPIGKSMLLSVTVYALHQLDYPFLRTDPRFAPWGFTVGVLAVLAMSITAPAITLERAVAEREQMEGEVRRLNQQLELRIEEALAAVRGRDEFLSIASHELRTPLTSLRLQIRMAQQLAGDESRMPERLRVIERQTARLEALVSQLLDLSRITAHRMELHRTDADLATVVAELVERMRPQAQLVHSPLQVALVSSLPGLWDTLRVEQVVVNLISNALKFGAGRQVELRLEDAGDQARLVVADHGIGVAAADQARIFFPFERAISSRHYGGLGLGLWISDQIVKAHGGSITLTSTPGSGATFTVLLPKAPREAPKEMTPVNSAEANTRTTLA
jgi:signal transduction histidine kinase